MVVINIPRQRQRAEEAGVVARNRVGTRSCERISVGISRERSTRRCLLKAEPEEFSDDEFVAFAAFAPNHNVVRKVFNRTYKSIYPEQLRVFRCVPLSLSLLIIGFEISSSLESLWHGTSANLNGLEKIHLVWNRNRLVPAGSLRIHDSKLIEKRRSYWFRQS